MRKISRERAAKTYNFEAQNEVGKAGEERFAARYPGLRRKGLKDCDFEAPDGSWVELKTDARPANQTGNFFFEVFSNVQRNTPGGPWQAYGKGADFFVYQFSCGAEWWFRCEELVNFLEKTEDTWQVRQVGNERYQSAGLLVPLTAVEHLRIEPIMPGTALSSAEITVASVDNAGTSAADASIPVPSAPEKPEGKV